MENVSEGRAQGQVLVTRQEGTRSRVSKAVTERLSRLGRRRTTEVVKLLGDINVVTGNSSSKNLVSEEKKDIEWKLE